MQHQRRHQPCAHASNRAPCAQVHPFAPGHFVVGGAWVGRIDAIEHNLTIAFDNGMVVRVRRFQGLESGLQAVCNRTLCATGLMSGAVDSCVCVQTGCAAASGLSIDVKLEPERACEFELCRLGDLNFDSTASLSMSLPQVGQSSQHGPLQERLVRSACSCVSDTIFIRPSSY